MAPILNYLTVQLITVSCEKAARRNRDQIESILYQMPVRIRTVVLGTVVRKINEIVFYMNILSLGL